jgi:low affinity Fe/Cu permease
MPDRQSKRENSSHARSGLLHGVNWLIEQFSRRVTEWVGSSWAFGIAVALVLIWAATGPMFDYSERWQLIINTGTTIVTFLMVFLIQRSQNKESLAVEVKLNELLASQRGASNELINVEDMSEEEIRQLHGEFSKLARQLQAAADEGSPHSITEAHRAMHRAHQSMASASRAKHPASNGKTKGKKRKGK